MRRVAAGFQHASDCAKLLQIHENRYSRYERGAAEPSHDLLLRICEVLETSPNELFGFERRPVQNPSVGRPPFSASGHGSAPGHGFGEIPQAPLTEAGAPPDKPRPASASPESDIDLDVVLWTFADAYRAALHAAAPGAAARADIFVTARTFNDLRRQPLAGMAALIAADAVQSLPAEVRTRLTNMAARAIEAVVSRHRSASRPAAAKARRQPDAARKRA